MPTPIDYYRGLGKLAGECAKKGEMERCSFYGSVARKNWELEQPEKKQQAEREYRQAYEQAAF